MKVRLQHLAFAVAVPLLVGGTEQFAHAEFICGRISSGKLAIKKGSKKCPAGYVRILDTLSLVKDIGDEIGRDAALAQIYGDGAAGALALTQDNGTVDASDLRVTSFSVGSGKTVYIDSGAVIRSTGTCDIAGTIVVGTGANAASSYTSGGNATTATGVVRSTHSPAGAGLSGNVAGSAATSYAIGGVYPTFMDGGNGGSGIGPVAAKRVLIAGRVAGGGGGAGKGTQSGGHGGGGITLYCKGATTISGKIQANGGDGQTGGGGGGGGVVIVASQTSIALTGSIEAKGGVGGGVDTGSAPGGGGAGGIVNLVAPSITSSGSLIVTGGAGNAAGAAGAVTSVVDRSPGSGGGGSCQGGGSAGTLNDDGSFTVSSPGDAGCSNTLIVANPAPLLIGGGV